MIRALSAGLCAGVALACALPARASPADDALIGLWAAHSSSLPGLHGRLTVSRKGPAWRASLGGRQIRVRGDGADLRFVFPDGGGQFRGRLADHGRRLDGFWLQPVQGFGALREPLASPLALRATGPGAWRGEVRPLANTFSLYLKVFRDTDGTLIAALRNPEAGFNGGRTQFLVSRDGPTVHISSRPIEGQRTITLDAQVLGDHLRLALPGLDHPFDLAREDPRRAVGFFPRRPGEPAYAYRAPAMLKDGWTTARATSTGLDEAALARVVQAQIDSDPAGRRPPLIHSILVAHRGKLVLEEYFSG
ncbi:MAG: hypothetical protein JWQ20_4448, partial [Conexibacter sp.]|nr:hypothetical protein [Conexibacter sp.]